MPRQSQTILLEALPASAFQQALGALQQARMKVTARSPDRMTLRAESPMSLRSFGETVTVSIEPAGGASRLTVASQPAIQGTLLDYGKGAENVERIVNLIQKSLPAS
ncbi:MAG: hypothetical protein IT210_07090 [Armatimonadetes bacterium]|nr:hypothetical protein [Armatimonadota bacterium]